MDKITDLQWLVEKRKVNDLIPAEYNPRQMTEKQAADLRKSIDTFGLVEIPVVDLDGTIIAGHQRVTTLKDLNRGDDMIDVRVPSRKLTQQEAMTYNVASNKITGEWDIDKLFAIPEDILHDVGFDDSYLKALAGDFNFQNKEVDVSDITDPTTTEQKKCPSCGFTF